MNTGGTDNPGDRPRDIGLKAVREARQERARSKTGRVTGRVWLVGISATLAVVFGAWMYRERSLDSQKEEILSKQRAALTTVGAEWFPLRDKLEKITLEAAGPLKSDLVDPEIAKWDFRTQPGIYLRMRVADAKDTATLRKKAQDSSRDSFAACLLKENNPSYQIRATGEMDAGIAGWHDQPWNLRLAYDVTRILSDEWVAEVKKAEDEIHLRVFVQQYDKAKSEEIPTAVEIIKRSQFFLLALDEGEGKEDELQEKAHGVRVVLVNLKADREMARLHLQQGAGEDVHVMRNPYYDPATQGPTAQPRVSAVKRQMNNCALAASVWTAINAPAAKP